MVFLKSKEETLLFCFFSLYLESLEKNEQFIRDLQAIEYHSDEANTDKGQKDIVKNYLLQQRFLDSGAVTTFRFILDDEEQDIDIGDLKKIFIQNVYLPEELTKEHKSKIKSSKNAGAGYTAPDLYLEVNINDETKFVSLELKSTKKDKIPGSSAQQADPYEWTIFIKQQSNNQDCVVTTGIYACTITGRLPFPDRSPRPEVSFLTLSDWNLKNRVVSDTKFTLQIDTKDIQKRAMVIEDWRYSLVEDWMEYIITNKKTSKWFDGALRMFAYKLLTHYEELDERDKKQLIAHQVKVD